MTKPIAQLPISDVKLTFVKLLDASREHKDGPMIYLSLSVLEYMKDAQRWHYTEGNVLPNLAGKELREYVDAELNK